MEYGNCLYYLICVWLTFKTGERKGEESVIETELLKRPEKNKRNGVLKNKESGAVLDTCISGLSPWSHSGIPAAPLVSPLEMWKIVLETCKFLNFLLFMNQI